MWRRLPIASTWRSARALQQPCAAAVGGALTSTSAASFPLRALSRAFSDVAEAAVGQKRVEDVMPIATGYEREEIKAALEGTKRFDVDAPSGPFGTKEAPAKIQSFYDKRLVGCVGGEGEEEHDVVWFWLAKGKPFRCPVCNQYFELEVVGPGGSPDGHDDDEEED